MPNVKLDHIFRDECVGRIHAPVAFTMADTDMRRGYIGGTLSVNGGTAAGAWRSIDRVRLYWDSHHDVYDRTPKRIEGASAERRLRPLQT